jgi:ABC-type multidrug transport system fused ATPase/permease subunit
MQGRTTFVIAHRLSTIKNADRILVLEEGRIVEEGAHDALMQKEGRYHHLWTLQFREKES